MTVLERRGLLVEALVVVLVALACVVFQLRLPGRLPDEADYQAVKQVLDREVLPGDQLLLDPWWAERARLYAPDGLKVVGYQGSDHDDLIAAPRVWVLSLPNSPGVNAGDFSKAFGPGRTEVGAERRFGNLSLTLFTNGRHRPTVFSAIEALPRAQVYLEDTTRTPCQWTGRSFRCPNGTEVAPEWHEIFFAPHYCLRFFPPGGSARLVAEWTGVPASTLLRLSAGYIWDKGYYHDGVTGSLLALEVNGDPAPLPLAQRTVPPQKVERWNTPAGATVRVSVAAANKNARDICIELDGFGGAP